MINFIIWTITGIGIGALTYIAMTYLWRSTREHRRAATHRGDTGPGDSAGFTGWGAITQPLATTATTYAGPGTIIAGATGTLAASWAGHTFPRVRDEQDPADLEPVRAWKQARVHLCDDGRVTFLPLVGSHPGYGMVADAVCAVRSADHHRVPDPDCTCGFYALNQPMSPERDVAMLEVELYGRVIVHDFGYRAEKQRVLSITALAPCEGYDAPSYPSGTMMINTTVGVAQSYCQAPARWRTRRGLHLCARHALAQPWRFDAWQPDVPTCETEWRWA